MTDTAGPPSEQPQPSVRTEPADSVFPAPASPKQQAAARPDAPPPDGPPALDERYGKPRSGMSRARKAGLAVAGLLVLGGVVGYIGWQQANPAITGTVLRFAAGDQNVSVTFEVDKPAAKTASCTLVADDAHNHVVGSVDVQVPSGRDKNVMSYMLSTTVTPSTVLVESCALTS